MNPIIEGVTLEGHVGTWYEIDNININGYRFLLMESEQFGDEAAHIIIDENYTIIIDESYNGFDDEAVEILEEYVNAISRDSLYDYK